MKYSSTISRNKDLRSVYDFPFLAKNVHSGNIIVAISEDTFFYVHIANSDRAATSVLFKLNRIVVAYPTFIEEFSILNTPFNLTFNEV